MDKMQNGQNASDSIILGKYISYWMNKTPRRTLHCLSYYKFASKLIGKNKKVLDLGCNEGFGTYLIGKECGFAKGIDFDADAISTARHNFSESCVQFEIGDFLEITETVPEYDAVINFDVIEHIYPNHSLQFFQAIKNQLNNYGTCIIGTPSLISQTFASEISKKGHVNIYNYERLRYEMSLHFEYVFIFSANDEVVHTGYPALAHYFIAIGCKKK